MKINIFKNGVGVISGADCRHAYSDCSGFLRIGGETIRINGEGNTNKLPILKDGVYSAAFVVNETEYSLGSIEVRKGFIVPQKTFNDVEIWILHRLDDAETRLEELKKKTAELDAAFDTDALNFLIKQ